MTCLDLGAPLASAATHADVVVVAGGDGSIHRAVQTLVGLDVPLGVIPVGTANDLARSLGIPLDTESACRVVAFGAERSIDLGYVCGRYFLNAAGLGLSAEVTRRLTRERKRRWGALGYARAAIEAIRSILPFGVTFRVPEGGIQSMRSIQVVVGNGRHYGGGMTVDEAARIDDHLLHVYSLAPVSWWRLAALLPSLRSGTQARSDHVHALCANRVTIVTSRPKSIHADGEWVGKTPAEFRVIGTALRLVVPEASDP